MQFNEINELNRIDDLVFKDFSYLKQTIDLRDFNKMRRVFRNELIKGWLGSQGYSIDYNFMKICIGGKDFSFSSSYSDYKVVVIKSMTKIGIDIEMYKKISLDHIHLFVSEEELSSLSTGFESFSILEKSTLIWCIKESVGKLFDVGLSKGFDAFKLRKRDKIYLGTCLNLSDEHSINIFYKMFDDYCIAFSEFKNLEINDKNN